MLQAGSSNGPVPPDACIAMVIKFPKAKTRLSITEKIILNTFRLDIIILNPLISDISSIPNLLPAHLPNSL